MGQIPCLASRAADREYFKPDAGDAYDDFCCALTDAEFDGEANDLAAEMHGDECNEWTAAQWEAFKAEHAAKICDRLWERA